MNTIIDFLSDLEQNNNREWFALNRDRYEVARAQYIDIVEKSIESFASFDPEIKYLTPKDCLYRIYRDIRFSPNKQPYKNFFGAYIAKNGGHKSVHAGYYIHIQPNNCFFAGGIWCTTPELLRNMRAAVDIYFDELSEVLAHPDFVKYFGGKLDAFNKLKKVPHGFSPDNPAAEFLKMKELIASHRFEQQLIDSPHFIDHLHDAALALKPFNYWCNENIFE